MISSGTETAGRWADVSWLTDHLAVSSCFPVNRTAHLIREYRIAAVVDLRDEDCDDAEALSSEGVDFLHLPTPDQMSPSVEVLDHGVAFARRHLSLHDRVLIHCAGGIGRSPLLALCVMVDQGWEPLEALTHAKDTRMCVSPSEAQYRGWTAWLERHGHPVPDYHSFGCIAYRHLAQG